MGLKYRVVGLVESFCGSELTKDGLVQHVIKASSKQNAISAFRRAHPSAKHVHIRASDPLITGKVARWKA